MKTLTARKILSVELRREVDSSPDNSHLGEYSDRPGPDDRTIDRQERGDMGRDEFRYFIAAVSGEDTGNPDSVEQDYQRMESLNRGDWFSFGVSAVAEVQLTPGGVIQKIRSGGLWGIESDSDKSYFAEVESEQLAELRGELEQLGFKPGAIRKAFKNARPAK
jgi:hypothetical protein